MRKKILQLYAEKHPSSRLSSFMSSRLFYSSSALQTENLVNFPLENSLRPRKWESDHVQITDGK